MENTDTHFDKPKKNNNADLIKKIAIVCVSIAVALFVTLSNCNKDKNVSKFKSISDSTSVTASDTSIDTYEKVFTDEKKDTNTFKKINSDYQNSADDPSGMSQMTAPSLNQRNQNQQYSSQPLSQQTSYQSNSYQSSNYGKPVHVSQPYKYEPENEMKKRLDPEYQNVVSHFKGTLKSSTWEIDNYEKVAEGSNDKLNSIEVPLKTLYDGADKISLTNVIKFPTGTRIIAITDQDVSSDHPGIFTATVVRPFEIKGSRLICQSSTNVRDRIPVQPSKLIFSDNTEIPIQGQVEMGFPGLQGRVVNHWPQRVLPAIASAAVGGGAAAYLLQTSTPGASSTNAGNISTRDLIAGPILEGSVQQVQSEVTRMAADLPNTVTVKKGTQFELLLSTEAIVK